MTPAWWRFRGLAYVPVSQLTSLRNRPRESTARAVFQQVSVGIGAGAYVISGDATVESPVLLPVMPVRVKVLPIELIVQWCKPKARATATTDQVSRARRLERALEYRAGFDFTLAAPNPADFRTAIPEPRREWLETYSLQVDLGRLLDIF